MSIQAWWTSAQGASVVRDPADPTNYDVTNSPARPFFIVHDIEGGAGGARSKFKQQNQDASTQFVVDGPIAYQMVSNWDSAYGCGNGYYNDRGVQVEIPGYVGRTYNSIDVDTAARLCAQWAKETGYPIRKLSKAEVSAKLPGVFGHEDVPNPNNPLLFGGKSGHVDPGSTFPWSQFITLAQGYLEKGGGPTTTPGTDFSAYIGYKFPGGYVIDRAYIRHYLTLGGFIPGGDLANAIRIFGYPVSGVLGWGRMTVQWFERARFETQPDGTITLGRVGAELYDRG